MTINTLKYYYPYVNILKLKTERLRNDIQAKSSYFSHVLSLVQYIDIEEPRTGRKIVLAIALNNVYIWYQRRKV